MNEPLKFLSGTYFWRLFSVIFD